MFYAIFTNQDRAWKIAVAFDELGNAATNGEPVETISSRANRAKRENKVWGCVLCGFLDFFNKDHCALSETDNQDCKK